MKALVKTKKDVGLEYQDVLLPSLDKKDVLVKIKASAICGSDIKIYEWVPWCENVVKSLPIIPGHECSGEVVEVGEEVSKIKPGDKVAAETHVPCGTCWQCKHNRPHTCERMQLFGHTINGCFAEYAIIPEAATRKIPKSIPFDKGCLLEPMGIPFRAVERGKVKGDAVVVVGCGPIGQFAIAFSKIMGAEEIIGIDINDQRLGIAEKMGATHLINPKKTSIVKEVKRLTKNFGEGAGVVIEASGNTEALKDAFKYLRVGGKLFIIGHPQKLLTIDVSPDIVLKEVKIIGLFGREIWDTWEKTEKILTSGELDLTPLITHRFPMNEFKSAFDIALSGKGCKILLIPE